MAKLFFLLNFSYIGIWGRIMTSSFHRRLEVCQRVYSRVWRRLLYACVPGADMYPVRISRLKAFGTICYMVSWGLVRSIMLSLRFSARYYSGEDGGGFACWTTMILDLLPYKQNKVPKERSGASSDTSCSPCRWLSSFSYFGLIWLMPIRCLYSL